MLGYGVSHVRLPVPCGYRELLLRVARRSPRLPGAGALFRQRRAVAELRAREEQLTAQSALLQSTLENMGEGLSVFDRDGRLIAWNSRFAKLLSLPVD